MEKEITIDNFVFDGELINVGEGVIYFNADNIYEYSDINFSGILDFLIKKAAEICKRYASDLFIDWTSLVDKMKYAEYKGETMLFGFRECGVDHAKFVVARYNNHMEKEIKELYMMKIVNDYSETGISYENNLRKHFIFKFGEAKCDL